MCRSGARHRMLQRGPPLRWCRSKFNLRSNWRQPLPRSCASRPRLSSFHPTSHSVPTDAHRPRRRGDRMRRRQFMALAGGAAAWPLVTRAQQPDRMRRIAVLLRVAEEDPDAQHDLEAFRKGLRDLGWTAGSNLAIEYRYASADSDQMRAYAAELVRLPAEVILAGGSLAVTALRQQTSTLPIVFVRVAGALSQGFVGNLANPGGNVTGFTS